MEENKGKISVLDQAVLRLEEFLLSSDLEVNEKLPAEMRISEALGIARPTLREAYRILEAKGYVNRIPGRGVFLLKKEKSNYDPILSSWFGTHKYELEEIFRVRLVLELTMIDLVLEKTMKPSLLEELNANFELFTEGDFEPAKASFYTRLDEEFHQILCNYSENEFMINIFTSVLTPVMHEPRYLSFKSELNWKSACKAHERIIKAIESNIAISLKEALEDHIRQTRALFYLNT